MQKNKRLCHEEKELIRRLNAKGYNSSDISEHLDIRGFKRRPAVVRGWLRRNGLNTGKAGTPKRSPLVVENKPKVLTYDIETTDFKADFGECICIGYQWNDGPTQVKKISDYRGWNKLPVEQRDKYLIADVRDLIIKADLLVGHYAKRFDHRFIQTRCMFHEVGPIPDTKHIDTWKIAKYQLAMSGNRLDNLSTRLGCANTKDKVDWRHWRRLKAHDQKSIDIIAEYCKQDVRATYDLAMKLLPICRDLPNWNLFSGSPLYQCPACGSENVTRHGMKTTKVHQYQRFQCQGCGRFSRGRTTTADPNQERHMW